MAAMVIRGGEVCSTTSSGRLDIRVVDGSIVEIGPSLRPEGSESTLDASGLTVVPGLVDVHVHLRDPGSPERETFPTGTAAAAAGGVTTVLEMPTADLPVTTGERLAARGRHLSGRSFVDFGLYAGVGRGSIDDVAGCADAGAVAFKTFMHRPAPARAEAFEGLWVTEPDELLRAMQAVATTGRVHAIHAESDALLTHFATLDQVGESFGVRHRNMRPPVVENCAVAVVGALAMETDARVHLVHVSTDRAVSIAHAMRALGADLSIETCAHYLLLDEGTLDRYGAHAKCNPPLRPARTREQLVGAVADGRVDIVASDHCSFTPEEIRAHADDPVGALPGLPGIEFLLPSVMTVADDSGIPLRTMLAAVTSAPARRFGLPAKGDIAVGADADLVLVDPAGETRFRPDGPFHARGSVNARYLEQVTLAGTVLSTLVRGRAVLQDGELVGDVGHGRWIRAR